MKLFSTEHIFRHPWHTVSSANWVKYPNEMTPHVVHVDYLSRHVDPSSGILYTERLLTCRQAMPTFAMRLFKSFAGKSIASCDTSKRADSDEESGSSYVYERSAVNPARQTLTLQTTNMTLAELMVIEETCCFTPDPADPVGSTHFHQEAQITTTFASGGWSFLKDRLEDFCVTRFQSNACRGRAALEHALERIYHDARDQIIDTLKIGERMTTGAGDSSGCPDTAMISNTTA